MSELLTISAAAELLSLSRSSLYDAMARGELGFCRFGRARRIPRAALEHWISSKYEGGWATMPGGMVKGFDHKESPTTHRAPVAGKHSGLDGAFQVKGTLDDFNESGKLSTIRTS